MVFFFLFFWATPRRADADDRARLTTLLAWERVFGRLTLRWDELATHGFSFSRDEGLEFITGESGTLPTARNDLYTLLFAEHPELKFSLLSPQTWLESLQADEAATQAAAIVPEGANAVVLRLSQHGPGGMNQQDTVDTALLAVDQADLWIPVDSAAAFNLCQNLLAVGGHFYLAFGDQLVLYVLVDQCIHDRHQRTPYPGPHNPWPVQQSYGWVRVAALRKVDIGPVGFSVRHGDEWGKGFANRAALLWAWVEGD